MIIKYTDQNFTLDVTDDRGDPITKLMAQQDAERQEQTKPKLTALVTT